MSPSRSAGWGIGGLLRVVVSSQDAEAFEADARRQVAEVQQSEPGTVVYGFFREAGAALGRVSYLHVMVYADEEAQQAHWAAEEVWWWEALSGYAIEPFQAERFAGDQLVQARRSAGSSIAGLVVASGQDARLPTGPGSLREGFALAMRRVPDDAPVVQGLDGHQVLRLVSVADLDAADQVIRDLRAGGGTGTAAVLGDAAHETVACLVRPGESMPSIEEVTGRG